MAEPVTLFDAKRHLRVEHSDDDELIAAYIQAARSHVENLTGRTLVATTRQDNFDCWQDCFVLAWSPVTAVASVKYVDTDGVLTTLDPTVYRVDVASLQARITLEYGQTWPEARDVTNAVQINYTTGGAAAPALKQAILFATGHFYEQRVPVGAGSLAELPHSVTALCDPYRVLTV